MQRGFVNLQIILIVVLGLILIGGYLYWGQNSKFRSPGPVVCTLEAKVCPDGSSVGRTGPKCEFTACPEATTSAETANWHTYSNTKLGFSLKYPEGFVYKEKSNGDVDFYKKGDDNRKDTVDGLGQHLSVLYREGSPESAAQQESDGNSFEKASINNAVGVKVIGRDFDYYLSSEEEPPTLRIFYLPETAINSPAEIDEFEKTFKTILTTFKFD